MNAPTRRSSFAIEAVIPVFESVRTLKNNESSGIMDPNGDIVPDPIS